MMIDDTGLVTDFSNVSVSELFHENSRQRRSDFRTVERILGVTANPVLLRLLKNSGKRYPSAQRIALTAQLPPSRQEFDDAIRARRSSRIFGTRPLAVNELAKLLAFGYGTVSEPVNGDEPRRRTCPSGGALYPLELYVAAKRVDGLPTGLYHYEVDGHALELVHVGDVTPRLARAAHTPELADVPAIVVLTGVPLRTRVKYGERGYRFLLLEAGHAGQNMLLTATALELAAVPIGGFIDDEVDDVLHIDGVEEISLYLVAFGPKTSNSHERC
jgi:SagB-type dehydrogenase family enzyme